MKFNYFDELMIFIETLVDPSHWIRLNNTDKEWDRRVRTAISEGYDVKLLSQFTAMIGGRKIWVGNYPYAFGTDYLREQRHELPSRRTCVKLKRYLKSHGIRVD